MIFQDFFFYQIYFIFTYKRSHLFKNPKFSGKVQKLPMTITLETKYAKEIKFMSKCVVLDTLLYSTKNSISIKSGFRPFSK